MTFVTLMFIFGLGRGRKTPHVTSKFPVYIILDMQMSIAKERMQHQHSYNRQSALSSAPRAPGPCLHSTFGGYAAIDATRKQVEVGKTAQTHGCEFIHICFGTLALDRWSARFAEDCEGSAHVSALCVALRPSRFSECDAAPILFQIML